VVGWHMLGMGQLAPSSESQGEMLIPVKQQSLCLYILGLCPLWWCWLQEVPPDVLTEFEHKLEEDLASVAVTLTAVTG